MHAVVIVSFMRRNNLYNMTGSTIKFCSVSNKNIVFYLCHCGYHCVCYILGSCDNLSSDNS